MAVTQGIRPARAKRGFSVPESSFLVPDGTAPLMRLDIGSDGNGLSRVQNWVEFIPDGTSAAAGRALTGEEGVLTRNFMPRYRTMERVIRVVAGLPTTDVNIESGARRKLVWSFPDVGAPPIETETWYYGLPDGNVAVLKGGKIRSFNIDTMRNGDGGTTSGNIEYHFNWVTRLGTLPGGAAANEVKRVILDGATGNGTLVVAATTLGAGGNVTVTPGMSAAALQTALAAKAAIGSSANVAVTGSSLTYGYATGLAATASGGVPGNAIDANNGTNWTQPGAWDDGAIDLVWLQIDLGSAKKINQVGLNITAAYGGGAPNTFRIRLSNASNFASSVVGYQQAANVEGDLADGWNDFAISQSTAYRYVRIGISGTTGGSDAVINEVRVRTLATGTYTVTLQGALANTNIADWTIGTAGYSTDSVTQGSAGSGPTIPTGPYLKANDRRVYLATSDADLATIDMTDMPNDLGVGGDAHLLASAYASGFSMADLYNVFYSHNGLTHATDFVPGAQNIGAFVTLPFDPDSLSDCEWLEQTAYGCAATGFWISYRDVCGGFEFWVDLYVTRTEAPGYGADNDVDSRTFNFGRAINPSGGPSLRFTLITPNL